MTKEKFTALVARMGMGCSSSPHSDKPFPCAKCTKHTKCATQEEWYEKGNWTDENTVIREDTL